MPTTQQQQQRFNTFWQYRALTHQLIQMGSAPPPGVAVEGAVPCNGKGGRGKHTLWAALPVGEEGLAMEGLAIDKATLGAAVAAGELPFALRAMVMDECEGAPFYLTGAVDNAAGEGEHGAPHATIRLLAAPAASVRHVFRLVAAPPPGAVLISRPNGAPAGAESDSVQTDDVPYDARWHDDAAALIGEADVAAFARDGFLVVRGAVPQALVGRVLRQINSQMALRLRGGGENGDRLGTMAENASSASLWKGELGLQRLLLETPALALAERLLGRDRVVSHCGKDRRRAGPGAQLAINYPRAEGTGPARDHHDAAYLDKQRDQFHVDGWNKGRLTPFSLLCGVALSSQTTPACGGLVVFPGSHHLLSNSVTNAMRRAEAKGLEGDALVHFLKDKVGIPRKEIAALGPRPVSLEPGDLVLVHPKLAHRTGVNASPYVRYQTYFRLRTFGQDVRESTLDEDGDIKQVCRAQLEDAWYDFQGEGVAEAGRAAATAARDGWEVV